MRVSLITKHNPSRPDLLAATIDSLFCQEYDNFEHIIVVNSLREDATDTFAMLQALEDNRFRLLFTGGGLELEENSCESELLAFEQASGDFICFLPEDWYLDEQYLKLNVKTMLDDAGISLILNNTEVEGDTDEQSEPFVQNADLPLSIKKKVFMSPSCFLRVNNNKGNGYTSIEMKTILSCGNDIECIRWSSLNVDRPIAYSSRAQGKRLFSDAIGI